MGAGVGAEIVQHVAEIDIGHIAERDDVREADGARRRPVEHRGHHRTRLADQRNAAGRRRQMRKTGIKPERWHDDADAIGADNAQQVWTCRVEHRLLKSPAGFAQFAETRGDHDCCLGTAHPECGDESRHGIRRSDDDREIGRLRQACDIGVHRHAVEGLAVRVDQQQLAGKAGAPQIAQEHSPDRAGPVGRSDQRDRARLEQSIEVADGHRATRSGCGRGVILSRDCWDGMRHCGATRPAREFVDLHDREHEDRGQSEPDAVDRRERAMPASSCASSSPKARTRIVIGMLPHRPTASLNAPGHGKSQDDLADAPLSRKPSKFSAFINVRLRIAPDHLGFPPISFSKPSFKIARTSKLTPYSVWTHRPHCDGDGGVGRDAGRRRKEATNANQPDRPRATPAPRCA